MHNSPMQPQSHHLAARRQMPMQNTPEDSAVLHHCHSTPLLHNSSSQHLHHNGVNSPQPISHNFFNSSSNLTPQWNLLAESQSYAKDGPVGLSLRKSISLADLINAAR
jgi:hypothetical protein